MANEKPKLIRLAEDIELFVRSAIESDGEGDFIGTVHYVDHAYMAISVLQAQLESFVRRPAMQPQGTRKVVATRSAKETSLQELARRLSEPSPIQEDHKPDHHQSRFRDLKLADVVAAILKKQTELHGKEIEKHAKEGGYQTKAKHFQTMLDGTLRNDGRFVNVGGNRWRLREPTLSMNGQAEVTDTDHH
jgi:hypothetical protein